jgi:hypothetical protein
MSGPQVFVESDVDPRWGQAMEGCQHDVYHLLAYCRVSARVDGGNACAVVAHLRGHTILLPYVRQEIDEKVWDATSPYGYGGPIAPDRIGLLPNPPDRKSGQRSRYQPELPIRDRGQPTWSQPTDGTTFEQAGRAGIDLSGSFLPHAVNGLE